MVDNETIESFLIQMEVPFQQLGEGLWRVDDADDAAPPVMVRHEPPIVYLRLKVLDTPASGREELYRQLLELNSRGIAFGAYALEGTEVLLVDALRADTLQLAELQASLESLGLAASEHYRELASLVAAEE